MIISEDTLAVVEYLDAFSEQSLRKKNDVSALLEIAAQQLDDERIIGLSFHGSALWKVFSLMRKSTPGSDGFAKLETEFAASMNHMREHIMALSEFSDDETRQRFYDVYLHVHTGSIRNICDLAHDFHHFKELQNRLKHGEDKP